MTLQIDMQNTIYENDTIAAVSTPPGEGGIGIVRISGKEAFKIADKVFVSSGGAKPSSYSNATVHHGFINKGGEVVDEVLLTVMKSPRTYTAEDIIEISCHGGRTPLKNVLETCLNEGARLAEPGEFTKRAFLNGRIDLAQAEAVLDVISSKSSAANKIAMEQLRGAFSLEIGAMRSDIIDLLSLIELSIDFSDEDVEFESIKKITDKVVGLAAKIKRVLDTSDKGIVFREGVKAVICGRPNVGKSSLMNALLRDERVIVTSIAGTTRDVIEESINIDGVRVSLSDTAGIIETSDRVEAEGIKRSKERLERADIVILVIDQSRSLSTKDKEIFNIAKNKKLIVALNKKDLPNAFKTEEVRSLLGIKEVVQVSAVTKEGLGKIEQAISDKIFNGKVHMPEGAVVTNLRHTEALKKALENIERAQKLTEKSYNGELLASDLREAVFQLGLIIGESIEDDVLDRIFSQFCIGK